MMNLPDPYIVLCMGGSGSRLLSNVLERSGVFMGGTMLRSPWSELRVFYHNIAGFTDRFRYKNPWPQRWQHKVRKREARTRRIIERRVPKVLVRGGYKQGPWGFKDPRSVFLGDVYCDVWPKAKLIHLVRDGRDVAARQLTLEPGWRRAKNSPLAWLRVWEAHQQKIEELINRRGMEWIRIRYEDLCLQPAESAKRLSVFLPAAVEIIEASLVEKAWSTSVGKWKTRIGAQHWEPIRDSLDQYGYV